MIDDLYRQGRQSHMLSNKKLMELLARQLGAENIEIENNTHAWPALCKIKVENEWLSAAIHFRRITLSHRNRDDVERRFQNSDSYPIQSPPGYKPILIGGWLNETEDYFKAIAGFEVTQRIGRKKRNSYFIPLNKLEQSPRKGWVTHISASEEKIHIFRPELLPIFFALQDGSETPPNITTITDSSGLAEENNETSAKRARRAAFTAIRSQYFSKKVKEAYNQKCAMCNLGSGTTEGAHIYPVEAQDSEDKVWNGVCLCRNHHRLFDTHKIAIKPTSWSIAFSPDIKKEAECDLALQKFIEQTNEKINLPESSAEHPREEMLRKRYDYFSESYQWLNHI